MGDVTPDQKTSPASRTSGVVLFQTLWATLIGMIEKISNLRRSSFHFREIDCPMGEPVEVKNIEPYLSHQMQHSIAAALHRTVP
jgi:hypothetical protein